MPRDSDTSTPNLKRFLECKALWEEYIQLSDDLHMLEGKARAGSYKLAVYDNKVDNSYPVSRKDSVGQLALRGAITSLQVRKTELAGQLRNTFHLEV